MKSKAQQYAEAARAPEFWWDGLKYATVRKDGGLSMVSTELSSKPALELAKWIIDVFDTPKIPGKQPGWSRED